MTNSFKKIAETIMDDYENGYYDGFAGRPAWDIFCYEYGGENGKWNGFKELYPVEANTLESMIRQSEALEEERMGV